jgi:hypothetical protein
LLQFGDGAREVDGLVEVTLEIGRTHKPIIQRSSGVAIQRPIQNGAEALLLSNVHVCSLF